MEGTVPHHNQGLLLQPMEHKGKEKVAITIDTLRKLGLQIINN